MAASYLASVLVCALASAACTARSAPAQLPPGAPGPDSITEVVFERRCFGCQREGRLVLRRDGSASRTVFGSARSGTSDRAVSAVVPAGAFDELTRLLVAERFFELNAEYRDPKLADGEWTTTTVVAAGGEKSVVNRNRAGPVSLQRLESHLDALMDRMTWKDAR